MTNIPYVIVNFGNQFKKNIVYYMVGTEMVWFSVHWASMPYILPISWWLDISICFRFSSKSSADQAGAKPCDVSATREGPPKQDLTQQLVLMRLGSLETSQAEPRELGRLQRLVTFTTTSHMSFHSDSFSHCLPTRTIEPKKTYAYPLHAARFSVAFQI